MVSVKNRYRKTLFKVKNGKILNQSGKEIASVIEGGLANPSGDKIVEVQDMQIISVTDGNALANLQGSTIMSSSGSIIGYVDGFPASDLIYGAAALVMFAY